MKLCVCVREREAERERQTDSQIQTDIVRDRDKQRERERENVLCLEYEFLSPIVKHFYDMDLAKALKKKFALYIQAL